MRLTDRDTAIARGLPVNVPEVIARLSLPEGETAVEVPVSLLPEVVVSSAD